MSLPLPIHSYKLRSTPASPARLVNCFAEALPRGAKSPAVLSRTPGVREDIPVATVGTGPIRATHAALGLLFVVSGNEVYPINEVASLTASNIGSSTGNIDIDSNDTSVVVVNNGSAYYSAAGLHTFSQITDPDFLSGVTDVEFLDNFLLFCTSEVFFCADLGSSSSFDALNFATPESSPDALVGMKVDHRQIFLFGERTVEIWENVGRLAFPFERAPGGVLEIGCLASRSVVKQDNTVYWIADDKTVRALRGNVPERVSQHGVEQSLTNECTISEVRSFAYSQEGHLFIVYQFPEKTWVYDATTREWHERKSFGYDFWLAGSHAQAFGLDYVGNSQNNRLGVLDPTVYGEPASWSGTTQRTEWTYQTVYAQGKRAFHKSLEIVLETGVGLTTGQGSDPEVMLEKSDDGGLTWQSLPNRKIGKIGKYRTRVRWYALGSAEQRVYRAAVSDPVKIAITDTQLDVVDGYV